VHDNRSLAMFYREFGDRRSIESIPSGIRWVAILCESGDYGRIVAAREIDSLRFLMNDAEHEQPEEREPGTGVS
jgi:hypothetical protein